MPGDKINCDRKTSLKDYAVQVPCAMVVSIVGLTVGTAIGWSAIIPKIQEDTTLPYNVTEEDKRWLSSVLFLGALPGSLISGYLISYIGCKQLLRISSVLFMLAYLTISYQKYKPVLHATRLLMGILNGLATPAMRIYPADLCEPKIRGMMTSLTELALSLGILISYILAKFLHWQVATLILAVPPLLYILLSIFIPESPYWSMKKGNYDLAKKSLLRLYGKDRSVEVDTLALDIKRSTDDSKATNVYQEMKLLKAPENWRPLVLAITIFFLREFGGQAIIFNYTVDIFRSTGAPIDEFSCTVVVGLIRFVCTFIGSFFSDFIGRRPLYLATLSIYLVAMLVPSLSSYMFPQSPTTDWIFAGCVLIAVMAFGLGLGPIPWIIIGEILPLPVKSIAAAINITVFQVTIFVVLAIFPSLIEMGGIELCFLCFSIATLGSIIVTWVYLPEMKGKSLIELEKSFAVSKKEDTKNSEEEIEETSLLKVFCGLAISMVGLSTGSMLGWSVFIPLIKEDQQQSYQLTDEDKRWLSSNLFLGGIIGSLLVGYIMNNIDKKKILQIASFELIIGWLFIYFQTSKWSLHIVRFLQGLTITFCTSTTHLYIPEICEPKIRGSLSALPEITVSMGILLSYILAKYVYWRVACLLLSIPPLIFLVSSIFLPQSPYWLIKNSQEEEARKVFLKLLGKQRKGEVDDMIQDIRNSNEKSSKSTMIEQAKLLKRPENWKPLAIVLSAFILREISGQAIIFTYTVDIFRSTGVPLDEFSCTILVGLMRVLFTIIGGTVSDCIGRRVLYLITLFVYFVVMLVSALFLYIWPESQITEWVFLISVLTAVLVYGLGVGPIPWVLIGEILPDPTKALSASISMVCFFSACFLAVAIFPSFISLFDIKAAMILFSTSTLATFIIMAIFLPETKNKSLVEIEKHFMKSKPEKKSDNKDGVIGIDNRGFSKFDENMA